MFSICSHPKAGEQKQKFKWNVRVSGGRYVDILNVQTYCVICNVLAMFWAVRHFHSSSIFYRALQENAILTIPSQWVLVPHIHLDLLNIYFLLFCANVNADDIIVSIKLGHTFPAHRSASGMPHTPYACECLWLDCRWGSCVSPYAVHCWWLLAAASRLYAMKNKSKCQTIA